MRLIQYLVFKSAYCFTFLLVWPLLFSFDVLETSSNTNHIRKSQNKKKKRTLNKMRLTFWEPVITTRTVLIKTTTWRCFGALIKYLTAVFPIQNGRSKVADGKSKSSAKIPPELKWRVQLVINFLVQTDNGELHSPIIIEGWSFLSEKYISHIESIALIHLCAYF